LSDVRVNVMRAILWDDTPTRRGEAGGAAGGRRRH